MTEKTMTKPEIDELDTYCGKWRNVNFTKRGNFNGYLIHNSEEAAKKKLDEDIIECERRIRIHDRVRVVDEMEQFQFYYPDDYLFTIQMPVRD